MERLIFSHKGGQISSHTVTLLCTVRNVRGCRILTILNPVTDLPLCPGVGWGEVLRQSTPGAGGGQWRDISPCGEGSSFGPAALSSHRLALKWILVWDQSGVAQCTGAGKQRRRQIATSSVPGQPVGWSATDWIRPFGLLSSVHIDR